jgi:hypothetical protein
MAKGTRKARKSGSKTRKAGNSIEKKLYSIMKKKNPSLTMVAVRKRLNRMLASAAEPGSKF